MQKSTPSPIIMKNQENRLTSNGTARSVLCWETGKLLFQKISQTVLCAAFI